VVGHGRPDGGHHVVGAHAALGGEALLERRPAVGAGAGQLEVLEAHGQVGQGVVRHAAPGQGETSLGMELGPFHVRRSHDAGQADLRHRRYAGTPAARMARPTRVFSGYCQTVLTTTRNEAATKKTVVTGCPGVRNEAARSPRRRNTRSASPVSPKPMKSTDTT